MQNSILYAIYSILNAIYEYRTITSYRSAISAFHLGLKCNTIGKHDLICQLMAGIFQQKVIIKEGNFNKVVNGNGSCFSKQIILNSQM